MKWLVDTMGIDELRERIIKERKFLRASATYPGGVPAIVEDDGDAPAGIGTEVVADGGVPIELSRPRPLPPLGPRQRRARSRERHRQRVRVLPARRHHHRPVPRARRRSSATSTSTIRITNRQNFVLRGLTEEQLARAPRPPASRPTCTEPGAELARDVVSCPGADTCNIAVTQSRGLASDIDRALDEAGLAEVGGVRINISGCTNSCGQHHISDIGFMGFERRAHGKSAPGYQMLLGGHVGHMEIEFGEKASKLPAKTAAEGRRAGGRQVRRRAQRRARRSREWLDRSGGAAGVGTLLKDLDVFPTPDENPDFYVDFDETGPYVGEVGDSECAT